MSEWTLGLIAAFAIVLGLACFGAAYAEYKLQWISVIF